MKGCPRWVHHAYWYWAQVCGGAARDWVRIMTSLVKYVDFGLILGGESPQKIQFSGHQRALDQE